MKHKPEIPKNYPHNDPTGFYTTFDIKGMFGWKLGLIKNWIKDDYVRPLYRVEDKRGKKSYFAGYQLYTIRLFKYLHDMGLSRLYAGIWSRRIENDIIKNQKNYNFAVFELKNGQIIRAQFHDDPKGIIIDYKEDQNDFFVLNFKRLIKEVDSVS